MIMEGCQGKPQIKIMERICPQCGHEVEIFSIDTQVACENCGFVIYNDTLTCVQWCKYARKCMGDEWWSGSWLLPGRKRSGKPQSVRKRRRLYDPEDHPYRRGQV